MSESISLIYRERPRVSFVELAEESFTCDCNLRRHAQSIYVLSTCGQDITGLRTVRDSYGTPICASSNARMYENERSPVPEQRAGVSLRP
jgi:hypothetical protein